MSVHGDGEDDCVKRRDTPKGWCSYMA
jgi:hypothetical protein